MKCAVIASGDELTTGAVVDENSAWISDQLLELGGRTALHLTVGDDVDAIIDAMRVAGERAEQVIFTGGLGPTTDDLTREAVCRFLGVGVVENAEALAQMERLFRAVGREMTDNNRKQAQIPAGAMLIRNPIGTAPGFSVTAGRAVFYFLPGVPRECQVMMEQTVLPRLREAAGRGVFRSRLLRTFGMTESMLDQKLGGLALPAGVRLGYRAVFPEIHLKLYAEAGPQDGAAAERALEEAAALVRGVAGEVIYSEDGRSLEAVVQDALWERKLKLALAESCTGGLVAKRLTDVPGSSDVLDRAYVVYSNRAKIEALGVTAATILQHGAVSGETALEMARGARERSGADLAVAITGIAGPAGGSAEKPVGTVYIALADQQGWWQRRYLFTRAERAMVRELTAQAALEIIRRRVLGLREFQR